MKLNKEKIAELINLMEVPEIRQTMLAKFEQVKLIFSEEIGKYYINNHPNLIKFPDRMREYRKQEENKDARTKNTGQREVGKRIEWKCQKGFFDTTRYVGMSEEEQIAVFQEYFKNSSEFRREILFEFFLKKMPYSDIYENTG
ncbi:MAG: hypothetical protein KAW12_18280 [Candidatus Aminicenantes bacterium]|nr:hypothetical protein [Candidatus Aminicenantes bacterium]